MTHDDPSMIPQCDPMQQARERIRDESHPIPEPGIEQAKYLGHGMVNLNAGVASRPQGGLDGMCNVLYASLETLETNMARLEQTLDPLMGPEVPSPEAPSLRSEPMVNSRIGHQLQEMNSRISRLSMLATLLVSRVDV